MNKENFTRWGFILSSAGSAVGLGNVWRFPYLCGQYGGLSFILVYLCVLLLICNPLMVAEIAIGRTAKSNFIDAYKILGKCVGMKYTWPWSFCGGWLAFAGVVMIIPAVFAAGLSADSGPGLTFISLPLVFKQLTGGWFWSVCFYLLLMLAIITSTISVFETLVNLFMDKLKMKRSSASLVVLGICISGFTAVTISFSGVWTTKFFGRDLFSLFDWFSSTFTTTIVSMTMALFVGYKAMKLVMYNIRHSATVTSVFTRYFLFTLRIFAPLGLSLLLFLAIWRY